MKKSGLFFAAFLLIGGLLRLTGSSSPAFQGDARSPGILTTSSKRDTTSDYADKLAATIRDFYGTPARDNDSGSDPDLARHLNVPANERNRIQFAIAILPDPVHTHLGLFFDRSIEALMQAAQKKGYIFDRAVLPWDRSQGSEPADPDARKAQAAEQSAREAFPGF